MKVTVLGSGTSQGVPVIACTCEVCESSDLRDKRTRASILVECKGQTIVIDTGPDFRTQMLRERVMNLDAVLFTHEHKDHIAGLDDIRAYNFKSGGKAMDVFASEQVQEALHREFPYVFTKNKYPGVPEINLKTIAKELLEIGEMRIIPIDVVHYKMPVKAFRIENFAYVTDANFISKDEKENLKGLDVLILNALRKSKHISHYSLEEAIALVEELQPKKAYFTHISHLMGKHADFDSILQDNISFAYDGLQIEI